MKIIDFLSQINGKIVAGNEETEVGDFYKDSRLVKANGTYIALIGENFDGNEFIIDAIKNGAKVCIVSKASKEIVGYAKKNNVTIVLVKNTLEALQKIAKYKRNLYNIPVVAVTGSVGKTSTKDMISSVLSTKYNVLKTQGNMNNGIGMPLTVLGLKNENALVVEMGMNHFGEISSLTNIAKPTISVVTNVGTAHIGNLGSRENILKAKLEILEGMQRKILVINNDNDLLHKFYIENKDNNDIEIHTYGIENKSEVMAENINLCENGTTYRCKIKTYGVDVKNEKPNKCGSNNYSSYECENINEKLKCELDVEVPVGGIHFVYNSLCAISVANLLKLNKSEMQIGIKNFKPTKNRMDITKLNNGVTIINDSYNASYDSMKMLLNYLSNVKAKRRIAVLGDMFELGEYSEMLHKKVGKEVANSNIDLLIVLGENSKYIVEEAIKCGMKKENIYCFNNRDEVYNFININWQQGDCILFKASNGMKFFEIADKLI